MQGTLAKTEVLHAPVLSMPVPTIAETDVKGSRDMPEVIGSIIRCTLPVSYLSLPALSVPAGFTGNGLPTAFQLIGRPFAEARLLAGGPCISERHRLAQSRARTFLIEEKDFRKLSRRCQPE